jgi:hypothetical protein
VREVAGESKFHAKREEKTASYEGGEVLVLLSGLLDEAVEFLLDVLQLAFKALHLLLGLVSLSLELVGLLLLLVLLLLQHLDALLQFLERRFVVLDPLLEVVEAGLHVPVLFVLEPVVDRFCQ